MAEVSLATLLLKQTKTQIYEYALGIAAALGLAVSSWQPGDPTRSLYHVESELLATLEEIVSGYVTSGFLDYAEGDWLKVLAKQVYNVDVPGATYATTDVVLTNAGGGVYTVDPGDITVKSSLTGKTYRSTTGGYLPALGSITISVEAEEPGSDSTAGAGEIDEMVTIFLGVTCSNPLAAVGVDEQDAATTRKQCRDKLGSLSSNGPSDVYSFVALNSTLTGTTAVNRVKVFPDSETGQVSVAVAGPSGAVSAPIVGLVQSAIVKWATPLCVTPVVASAVNSPINVIATIWIKQSVNLTSTQIQAGVQSAMVDLFDSHPIGGDILLPGSPVGVLAQETVESKVRSAYPSHIVKVDVAIPSSDVSVSATTVLVLGTVTTTVNFV